jgi:hypothetical protein
MCSVCRIKLPLTQFFTAHSRTLWNNKSPDIDPGFLFPLVILTLEAGDLVRDPKPR